MPSVLLDSKELNFHMLFNGDEYFMMNCDIGDDDSAVIGHKYM